MTEAVKRALEDTVRGNEYMQRLGIELLEVEEGRVKGRMPFRKENCNPYGSTHGGVLYSLADIIAGLAACTSGFYSSTMEGNLHFLAPAMDTEYITCEAIAERQGRRIGVYRVELRDDGERLLDSGSFSFYMLERPVTEQYTFYGWLDADLKACDQTYPGIDTPRELYAALSELWCAETCAPRMRQSWSPQNKTLGQCSVTAFLAQDIFGGEVRGILRPGGNYHCYNVVQGHCFDLTSEQFGEEVLDYRDNPLQLREEHFAKEEKRLRYETLKGSLRKYCRAHAE